MENPNEAAEENKVDEETTDQAATTDETNDNSQEEDPSQKNEENEEQEDWTPPTQEDFEKVQKKAKDFDGIIEKQRLKKLREKEQITDEKKVDDKSDEKKEVNLDEVARVATEAAQNVVRETQKEQTNVNLQGAYKKFLQDNIWADNDDVISNISKNFEIGNAVTEEQILVRLGRAAEDSYPTEFNKSKEDKMRNKILADQGNIDAGGSGGGAVVNKNGVERKAALTKEQIEMAKKSGNDPKDVY